MQMNMAARKDAAVMTVLKLFMLVELTVLSGLMLG